MGNIREHDVDGIRVKVELEAEDSLAVKLQSVHAHGTGPAGSAPVRQVLERQARTIVDDVTYLDGPLGVIEVDGVSNAVQIRTRKPETAGKFVEVVLRGGKSVEVDARGGSVHVARENYEKLIETVVGVLK
jgi:hypothetical protein